MSTTDSKAPSPNDQPSEAAVMGLLQRLNPVERLGGWVKGQPVSALLLVAMMGIVVGQYVGRHDG